MKAFLIDVKSEEKTFADEVIVENKLENYYELLDCTAIDIVSVKVENQRFDIIVDDEGMLIENPLPSASCENYEEYYLFGNILIVRNDGEGNTIGITEADVKLLKNNIFVLLGQNKQNPAEQFTLPHLIFEI